MGNAARKARKRAGVQFEHPVKVGTSILLRQIPVIARTGDTAKFGAYSRRLLRKRVATVELLSKFAGDKAPVT